MTTQYEATSPVRPSRAELLVRGLDHEAMIGVEVGPWYSPVAPRAGGWRTVVVDFASGEQLRESARSHSAASIRASADQVEDVDVIWNGVDIAEPLIEINSHGYDFLIASHVLEHLPDLIGFFKQIGSVIKETGIVSLALPDMRYCFDFLKPATMTDDLLQAHREKRRRHSPETLFKAQAYQSWVGGNGAWLRHETADVRTVVPISVAYALYKDEVAAGDTDRAYIDAHAWVFVPANFELVMLELNALKIIDFYVSDLIDGEGSEFFVQLKRGRVPLSESAIEERREVLLRQITHQLGERKPPLDFDASVPTPSSAG